MVTQNKSGEVNFWVKHFFRASSFFGIFFSKELVSLFYQLILTFLIFVNCKGPYLETSSQHLPIFDIVLAQLGVIPRVRIKFVEIVVVAEC